MSNADQLTGETAAAEAVALSEEKGSMTMIARAEMSSTVQNSPEELSGSKGMSVALIGPNDTHRQIVARALSSAEGRKVHEFIDYPAKLSELPHMLEQKFDVVLVDVDTDQSYALQIIEKLAEMGPAVMAYSARNDQELLMACMRAGARDFLPLPSEGGEQSATESVPPPKPQAPVSHVAPKQAEPKQAVPNPAAATRSNVTPIVPEKKFEAAPEVTEIRPPSSASLSESESAEESFKPEPVVSDFAEWDAANLRRAQALPAKRPEARPRPSLVPERRHTEVPPSVVPKVTPAPLPAVERPAVSTDIFRSYELREADEKAARQGANWIKWILIAAGPLVLALVLLIVFTRPSAQNTPAASKQTAPAPTGETASAPASGQLIVDATGNRTTATPAAKPSPASIGQPEQTSSGAPQVSADAMAAQLEAPSRIAGNIKKNSSADEPPPAAPAPIAMEENSAIPGSLFGGPAKAKYAPKVVAISAGVADGMIIHKTAPVYPRFAQDAHITGKVVLKATITKQGTIEGVQVMSGPKILAPSAVDAVKTWKYRPYTLDGQPVAVETTISIIFGTR